MTLGDPCSVEQPPPPPVDFSQQPNHLIAPTSITSAPGTPTAFQPPQPSLQQQQQQSQQQQQNLPQQQQPTIFNPALMAAQLGVFNNPQLVAMMQAATAARSPIMPHPGVVGPPIMPNILQQLNAIRNAHLSNANQMVGMHRIAGSPKVLNNERSENCGELCVVCGDKASGRHYGAVSCEGCKGFFKRSIRKQIGYICRSSKDCPVTKFHRNRCQYCRLRKCLAMGMRSESVQAERRPVNSANSDSPPNLTNTPRALTPLNSGLVNGILSLVKMEQENQKNDGLEKLIKKERPSTPNESCSPTNDFIKRESIGEDESGIDSMTVIGLVPSASPTSSGVGSSSSMSDDTGPIFNAERSRFEVPVPVPAPTTFSNQYMSETASRLLFLSVHWIKDIRITLRSSTLESVLKSKWCDVFILGLMQTSTTINLIHMLENMSSHLAIAVDMGHLSSEKFDKVNEQIQRLIQLARVFGSSDLSDMEYAYLKLISFTNEDLPNSVSTSETRQANLTAAQELFEHVSSSKSSGIEHINVDDSTSEDNDTHVTSHQTHHNNQLAVERFSRLLQLLPCLRWFDPIIIAELFFSGLLGQMSIETVIPFVLQMNMMNFFHSANSSSNSSDTLSTTSISDLLSQH